MACASQIPLLVSSPPFSQTPKMVKRFFFQRNLTCQEGTKPLHLKHGRTSTSAFYLGWNQLPLKLKGCWHVEQRLQTNILTIQSGTICKTNVLTKGGSIKGDLSASNGRGMMATLCLRKYQPNLSKSCIKLMATQRSIIVYCASALPTPFGLPVSSKRTLA